MNEIIIDIPSAVNEIVRNYVPGSSECINLQSKLAELAFTP